MSVRPEDIRHHFEDQLEGVRREAVRLGGLVLENSRRVAEAMLDNDLELAGRVIAADEDVDALYGRLERLVFEVLARQQPVAGDLRLLVSVTRMLYELERSGDLAVNCARSLRRSDGFTLSDNLRGILARLCREACDVFAQGIDSLADMDPVAGAAVDKADDAVDDLVSEYYRTIALESRELGLEQAIELSRVGRYMERIADHAVNIGDHVTYVVTGAFPRGGHAALADES